MRLRFATLVLAPVLLLAAAYPTGAQSPPEDGLSGTWALVSSVEGGRATIQGAFDRALLHANVFLRALARQRVDVDVLLARRITVAFEGERISTTLSTRRPHTFLTRRGHPERVRGENGDPVELTQTEDDGRLQLYFRFDEGQRWTVLEANGDRLRLTTTIDADRLEDNVHFVLRYRRLR
ncbi:MAG: hypothetical protein AB8I08_09905 [Sandaracinaceae bacterium]